MSRFVWIAVLLSPAVAVADDSAETAGLVLRVHNPEQDEPVLHLDDELLVAAKSLGATEQSETHVFDLGPRARLATETRWWSSTGSPDPIGTTELEIVARGWRMGGRLAYDFGPFQLEADVAMSHVGSRFESGDYRTVGLRLIKRFRLSRWMLAWISLGVSQQQWVGKPPAGEANGTTVTLSIGTTFR